MKAEFEDIINHEKTILLFYEYFRNNEFCSKNEFILFLKDKTFEKTEIIGNLNNLIQKEIFDIIDVIDKHQELIQDILKLAEDLFQYELDGKYVYLDVYLSREIFIQMLGYFEKVNDIDNQLVCLYWLLVVSASLSDYDSGIFYYKKAKKFLINIYSLSEGSKEYVLKIMINKTLLFPVSKDYLRGVLYSKALIKYINKNFEKLGISIEKYNFWMFVLHNNMIDHSILFIRDQKNKVSKKFISQAYEHSKTAKEFEIKIDGDVISTLTPLILEVAYYNGNFNREEHYEIIGKYLLRLKDSKQSDSFHETKEEIEVSLRELYLVDILNNKELPSERKIELMQEIFDIIFKTFAKSRMTQDEMAFRKYIINYLQIATKIIPKERVIGNILVIFKHLHPFTFVHSIEVSSISVILTEEIILSMPEYFIGLFGYKNEKDVIDNASVVLNFVKYAALAHDFGKIGIISIISKLNRLTDYEFESIKQHSIMGYEILSASPETKNYSYIALSHHKMNGLVGGYPPNILEECHKFSPIISIVNLADTITAATDIYGRTYNGKKHLSDVQGEINMAKERYDKTLIEVFNKDSCIDKIKHIITSTREDLLFRVFTNKEVAI